MSRKFSGTASSAAVMSNYPVRMNAFAALAVQITDAGTSCTLSFEASNDAATWYPAKAWPVSAGDRRPIVSTDAVGLFIVPKQGAYHRVRVSTYGSGSPDHVSELMESVPLGLDVGVPSKDWFYAAAGAIADTTPVSMKTAVAGERNYVKSLQLINKDPSVACEVIVKSASTVIHRTWVTAIDGTAKPAPVPTPLVFDPPLRGGVNEAITVEAGTTSAELYANAQGYTSPN